VARALNYIETASAASGVLTGFASTPSGADNAIIRVDAGTVRWSHSASFFSASAGLLLSAADPPFRIDELSKFKFIPMGGAAAIQALYYAYEARSFVL
jgi:hypothetical protein